MVINNRILHKNEILKIFFGNRRKNALFNGLKTLGKPLVWIINNSIKYPKLSLLFAFGQVFGSGLELFYDSNDVFKKFVRGIDFPVYNSLRIFLEKGN